MPAPVPPLPDLTGRRALVTGASDGVGLEIARALAGAGAEVVMPVRNRAKGDAAAVRIRETVPEASLVLCDLDLADFSSVRRCSADLLADGRPIDLCALNAGIVALRDPVRHVTVDGDELHLQTNHLGHVALVAGILPLLRAGSARVVAQCSLAAARGRVRWDDLQFERHYSPLRAYASSKVALGLFAYELGRRSAARGWGLTVHVGHPGIAPATGIAPLAMQSIGLTTELRRRLTTRVGNPPAMAARPALLALTTDAAPVAFFGPSGPLHVGGPPAPQRPYASLTDAADGARMWAISEELTGIRFP
jgi:NAD(P)-dependent dehydrogenase (short-subunit alcohol dehydrogenase family)